jgi:RimJ/RimL family protein N-acetyltransferase
METKRSQPEALASGPKVVLRDRIPSDVDRWIYWQTHGEWRTLDAPWEGVSDSLTPEKESELRARFLEVCAEEPPVPRARAAITTRDGRPVGWVNRYADKNTPDEWYVGIDICEDDCLNRGIGTEALRLWVDYLFANSDVHRIALATWSFNPRMMRVAEKVGFVHEGVQREARQWRGEWLDGILYGMLREEWEVRRGR